MYMGVVIEVNFMNELSICARIVSKETTARVISREQTEGGRE
jgi:hypothetical protein